MKSLFLKFTIFLWLFSFLIASELIVIKGSNVDQPLDLQQLITESQQKVDQESDLAIEGGCVIKSFFEVNSLTLERANLYVFEGFSIHNKLFSSKSSLLINNGIVNCGDEILLKEISTIAFILGPKIGLKARSLKFANPRSSLVLKIRFFSDRDSNKYLIQSEPLIELSEEILSGVRIIKVMISRDSDNALLTGRYLLVSAPNIESSHFYLDFNKGFNKDEVSTEMQSRISLEMGTNKVWLVIDN